MTDRHTDTHKFLNEKFQSCSPSYIDLVVNIVTEHMTNPVIENAFKSFFFSNNEQ